MTNEELYDVPGLAAGAGGAGWAGGEAEGVGGDVVVDVDIAQQLARYTTHSHAAPSSQYCKLNYTGTQQQPAGKYQSSLFCQTLNIPHYHQFAGKNVNSSDV